MHSLWDLATRFVQIGFFSIGGGYAVIPLIQEHIVTRAGWLDIGEYMDIITISQMTPGPLAVNVSTFVGLRLGGIAGAVVATISCVICGLIISLALRTFFRAASENAVAVAVLEGLKAASVGLIASAAMTIFVQTIIVYSPSIPTGAALDMIAAAIFCGAFFAFRRWKASPTLVLIIAGCIGLAVYWR